MKNGKSYQYEAKIEKAGETGGAYVPFPYDIRTEFGKGRVRYMRRLTESLMTAVLSIWG